MVEADVLSAVSCPFLHSLPVNRETKYAESVWGVSRRHRWHNGEAEEEEEEEDKNECSRFLVRILIRSKDVFLPLSLFSKTL